MMGTVTNTLGLDLMRIVCRFPTISPVTAIRKKYMRPLDPSL